jgi:glycosyltransferase involved in cell wall biosynthesis
MLNMRICQIMLARGFGGAERYFVDLSHELARRGHEVLAVCHPAGMVRARLKPMSGLEIATRRPLGPWDPILPRRLRALIADYRPAVVQAHLARAVHLAGKALANKQAPLLAKTHNYVNLKYYRGVDIFLPTTRDQAAYLAREGVAADCIHVIPNFSALPVTTVPVDRPPAVVAMGRFVPKKGFAVLFAALAELRRRGAALPPVLLAGDGPLRGELQRAARDLRVDDVVQFAGWQQDPALFLDRGSVFVLPSLDEPFGIAVLEAMARGLSVVATMTQGPREVLDADSAWLVPPGDSNALADALAESLSQPQVARARAAHAAARFASLYSAEVVVPQLLSIYASASAKHAGRTQPGEHDGHG